MRYEALIAMLALCPALAGGAPRSHQHTAEMRVERPGKPTGPISVEHRLAAEPAVGVPLAITVTARVNAVVDGLSIEATASAPQAALVTPARLLEAANGRYVWQITVVPLAAEAGYLRVLVAGLVDGTPQAQSLTISLRSAAPEADAPVATSAGGEPLIALPAKETP